MIRETIVSALKMDGRSVGSAAEELEMQQAKLSDFCGGQRELSANSLDDLCELLDLKLLRVFTRHSWDAYLESAWESWGSKEPSLEYAEAKAEEWAAYAGQAQIAVNDDSAYESWSREYDEREFDSWEDTALVEFEKEERDRLEKLDWVRWA